MYPQRAPCWMDLWSTRGPAKPSGLQTWTGFKHSLFVQLFFCADHDLWLYQLSLTFQRSFFTRTWNVVSPPVEFKRNLLLYRQQWKTTPGHGRQPQDMEDNPRTWRTVCPKYLSVSCSTRSLVYKLLRPPCHVYNFSFDVIVIVVVIVIVISIYLFPLVLLFCVVVFAVRLVLR